MGDHRFIDRLPDEVRTLYLRVHTDNEMERLRKMSLEQRDRSIIACAVEIVVSVASIALYDIERSFLIPALNTILTCLSVVGLRGALEMNLRMIQIHGIVTAGLIIACVVNFICEALFAESGLGSDTLPQWIVLTLLLVPYSLNFGCSCLNLVLGVTLSDLQLREEECYSLITCEQLEQQAQDLMGQDVCCICMSSSKDAVLTPCGHKAMCVACGQKLLSRGKPCPVCRARIQSVVRVFES